MNSWTEWLNEAELNMEEQNKESEEVKRKIKELSKVATKDQTIMINEGEVYLRNKAKELGGNDEYIYI